MNKKERASAVLQRLKLVYPDAHCELDHTNALELLVATILSAQCTDKRVNIVTKSLFAKYKTAKDYATADLATLEEEIKSTGFFRNKAKNIQAAAQTIVDRFSGEVPQTMDELVSLEGVGRKTANVVLCTAFGINVGIVVDTHVIRLSRLLGLTSKAKTPDAVAIEKDLMKLIPQCDWGLFSHLLVWHGRRRCSARKPACAECELADICPSASP